jgi:hypothetical protein
MLRTLRHWLILVILILLPFHALLVTVGTKALLGTGNAPMTVLAMWKEGVIGLLFVIGIIEMAMKIGKGIKYYGVSIKGWRSDVLTVCVLLMLAVAFVVAFSIQHSASSLIFGFKYLFVPLIFFLLLKNLEWDREFIEKKVMTSLLVVGGIVAVYGIASFFLPTSFFTALGYSDAHSLYAPGSSLSAFQQISGTGIRRIQSVMSGPNQLGLWLLIPWSLGLVRLLRGKVISYWLLVISLIGVALFLTFSRSAWIAAFIITLVASGILLKGKWKVATVSSLIGVTIIGISTVAFLYPELFVRSISNQHHFERTRDGITMMLNKPLGHGLGSAGPASNRTSDACIYFEEGSDFSWASDRQDLCIFVGNMQVQPPLPSGRLRSASQPLLEEKECKCPVLPENWYVQVGIELGIVGFILFIILTITVLKKLLTTHYSLPTALMFIGISIASLFLHAWEDSAVAYTVWGLVGIVLARRDVRKRVSTNTSNIKQ